MTPLILMDSHLYSYSPLKPGPRRDAMRRIVGEVRAVHGEATVLWHHHTLGPDYGWGEGFRELLEVVTARAMD